MSKIPSTARLIASVVLRKDDKMLVLHEPDDNGDMRFNLPGGHVEPGEDVLEAAIRETREETGLEITVGHLIQIISSTWKDGTHSIRQTFEGQINGGALGSEQGSEIVWVSENEVNAIAGEKFIFGVKEALLLALKQSRIPSECVIIRNKGEIKKLVD